MKFWIQTGSPALRDVEDVADDMADAITLLYPMGTEFLILSWNRVPIAVNYCEDVHVLVDDIVGLLEELQNPETAHAHVYWGSSTFRSEWWINRQDDDLVIDARWDSTHGGYEPLLNERGKLTVNTALFIGEWMKVIRRLVTDLTLKSVRMEDAETFERARQLLAGPPSEAVRRPASARVDAGGLDGGPPGFRFHTEHGENTTLWRPEPEVAHLFKGHSDVVADLLRVPSGISGIRDEECVVDLPAFAAFCSAAISQYAATDQGVQRSLTVGFIATALVLLDRAGLPMPTAPTSDQHAAWAALREQHAALMPR